MRYLLNSMTILVKDAGVDEMRMKVKQDLIHATDIGIVYQF